MIIFRPARKTLFLFSENYCEQISGVVMTTKMGPSSAHDVVVIVINVPVKIECTPTETTSRTHLRIIFG